MSPKRHLCRFAITELVPTSAAWAPLLSFIVLGSCYAFVMLVVLPRRLRIPLPEGGMLTTGVPMGAVLIIGSWLLTGFYVSKANKDFDRISRRKLVKGGELMFARSHSCCFAAAASLAWAGPGAVEEVQKQPLNLTAIGMFFVFVLGTLGITYWAARRTKSTSDFYTAGGGISASEWPGHCR